MRQANLKTLRKEFINPFTRLLPLKGWQADVYRYAEMVPPGLEGYQPRWEIVNAVLGAQQTLQVKVDLMTDFHVLALLASASVNNLGGFRAEVFDIRKKRKLMDRPMQFPQIGGNSASPFFLREPYHFDEVPSQMLVIVQNMELVQNTVQLAFYGASLPFQGTLSNE